MSLNGLLEHDEYIRSLMTTVVETLVDATVAVSLVDADLFSTLEVRAMPEAISVLIGPKGQMARALRTLLAGSSAKLGKRYSLTLIETSNVEVPESQ